MPSEWYVRLIDGGIITHSSLIILPRAVLMKEINLENPEYETFVRPDLSVPQDRSSCIISDGQNSQVETPPIGARYTGLIPFHPGS